MIIWFSLLTMVSLPGKGYGLSVSQRASSRRWLASGSSLPVACNRVFTHLGMDNNWLIAASSSAKRTFKCSIILSFPFINKHPIISKIIHSALGDYSIYIFFAGSFSSIFGSVSWSTIFNFCSTSLLFNARGQVDNAVKVSIFSFFSISFIFCFFSFQLFPLISSMSSLRFISISSLLIPGKSVVTKSLFSSSLMSMAGINTFPFPNFFMGMKSSNSRFRRS